MKGVQDNRREAAQLTPRLNMRYSYAHKRLYVYLWKTTHDQMESLNP